MWTMPRITLAKEELAKPAIEKPVPTTIVMSVPLWSAQIATVDFTASTVLTIIVKKINAPNTELVPSVMQNTMSSRASDIDAGLPPAQAVKKWSRSTHTNVLFSRPWTTQKKMLMMMIMVRKNPSLHPSLSMPTLRLCSCRTDNLKPTCCVTGPAKARRSLPTRERTVSAPSYMISTMQPRFPTMTVREPSSSSFTISEVLMECLL